MKNKKIKKNKTAWIPDDVKRILFIKLSSLGDIVLTTPVLSSIKKKWPNAEITYLVETEGEPLIRHNPDIDEVVIFNRGRAESYLPFHPFKALTEVLSAIKKLRKKKFDIAFDFQGLFKSWIFLMFSRAVLRVGKGRFIGVDIKSPHRRNIKRHAVPSYFEVLILLGLKIPSLKNMKTFLYFTKKEEISALRILKGRRKTALLNPFTTWQSKRWSVEYWIELGKRLTDLGYMVIVSGAGSDNDLSKKIARKISKSAKSIAGKLNLLSFAALLNKVNIFVTVDSAPMHIASAFKTPTVSLFGSTDPQRTGPWQGKGKVIAYGCDGVPCLKRTCYEDPAICMTEIGVDEVLKAVKKVSR